MISLLHNTSELVFLRAEKSGSLFGGAYAAVGGAPIAVAEENHRGSLQVAPRHLGHQTAHYLLRLFPAEVEDCLSVSIVLLVEHFHGGVD